VSKANSQAIGVLGGTFDPPHIGHLILAQSAYEELRLDKVVFVPAAIQPHKMNKISSPAEIRYRMLQLAIAEDSRFQISDIEISRPGISYTIDTLTKLRQIYVDARLYLLIGADNIADIATWKDPEKIFTLCEVAAALRPEFVPSGPYADHVLVFDMPAVQVSSTLIRKKVQEGLSIKYLVPPGVEEYVRQNRLYIGD
jgi:nicotinate-nucleotide adenylyltransferase